MADDDELQALKELHKRTLLNGAAHLLRDWAEGVPCLEETQLWLGRHRNAWHQGARSIAQEILDGLRELKAREGSAALAEWEAEHGALTTEELEAARAKVATRELAAERLVRMGLESETEKLQRQLRLQQEQNITLNKQLEAVDELCGEWNDDDATPAARELGKRLTDVLLDAREPASLPYPDAVHASFHWRDQKRPDGYYHALPGDGFGFVGATESKLSLQFDCAGVMACADLTYETLRPLLAKEGFALVPLEQVSVKSVSGDDTNGLIAGQRERIAQLEKELGWAKRDVEIRDEIAEKLRTEGGKADEPVKHVQDGHEALVAENAMLQRKLDFCEKLTEQIATLEDRRVLDAMAALPVVRLARLGSAMALRQGSGTGHGSELDVLITFELARRIAKAALDLPYYESEAKLIETPHAELFEQLEKAEVEGRKAAQLSPKEREARFEAYLRKHGYLKEGECCGIDADSCVCPWCTRVKESKQIAQASRRVKEARDTVPKACADADFTPEGHFTQESDETTVGLAELELRELKKQQLQSGLREISRIGQQYQGDGEDEPATGIE